MSISNEVGFSTHHVCTKCHASWCAFRLRCEAPEFFLRTAAEDCLLVISAGCMRLDQGTAPAAAHLLTGGFPTTACHSFHRRPHTPPLKPQPLGASSGPSADRQQAPSASAVPAVADPPHKLQVCGEAFGGYDSGIWLRGQGSGGTCRSRIGRACPALWTPGLFDSRVKGVRSPRRRLHPTLGQNLGPQ